MTNRKGPFSSNPFLRLNRSEWLNLRSFAFAVTASVYIVYTILYTIGWTTSNDFLQFWLAGRDLLRLLNPYRPDVQPWPFVYPLWAAWPFVPLAALNFYLAMRVWMGINFGLLGLCVLALWRRQNIQARFLYVAALCLWVAWPTVFAGQPAVLLLTALMVMLRLWERGFQRIAGASLALLLFKPQVTFLILAALLWLGLRHRDLLIGFAAGALALIIGSFAIQPNWVMAYSQVDFSVMQSTATGRWPTATFPSWVTYMTSIEGTPLTAMYILFVLLVLLVWVRAARQVEKGLSVMDFIALSTAFTFLITPYAREYDFALLVLPLLAALGHARDEHKTLLALTITLLGLHLYPGYMPKVYVTPVVISGFLLCRMKCHENPWQLKWRWSSYTS